MLGTRRLKSQHMIMGNSKTITVKTEGGDVVVRKLALGDYAALLHALKKLPAELSKFVETNNADALRDNEVLFTKLPAIIAEAIPEFAEVLAIASDKDAKFYLEGDLADAIEVFAVALELNDYNRIVTTIKKVTARRAAGSQSTAPAAASTTGSTEQ